MHTLSAVILDRTRHGSNLHGVLESRAQKRAFNLTSACSYRRRAPKPPFFDPSERHNVIMQGACLLLSLTESPLKIFLLPGSTPRISTLSTGVDISSLAISQRIRTSNNEYSDHGWTLR